MGWLRAAYGAQFQLKARIDFDAMPALAEEREALWRRVGDAAFLSDAEKRSCWAKGGVLLVARAAGGVLPCQRRLRRGGGADRVSAWRYERFERRRIKIERSPQESGDWAGSSGATASTGSGSARHRRRRGSLPHALGVVDDHLLREGARSRLLGRSPETKLPRRRAWPP